LAAERREDILDAFEHCILERGIQGSSFQRIAQMLGMDRNIISHYFGNRDALVDAMTQRIVDGFDSRMREMMNLEQSTSVMALVDVFYGENDSREKTEILWAEIVAYSARSEFVRNRLRQSYDKLFCTVGKTLKREYPNAPEKQLQTAIYTVATLLDRSPTFEWIGVKGSPIKSAKVAIEKMLENLDSEVTK
jgi:AcrR family transcriptional regulator